MVTPFTVTASQMVAEIVAVLIPATAPALVPLTEPKVLLPLPKELATAAHPIRPPAPMEFAVLVDPTDTAPVFTFPDTEEPVLP